MRHISFHSISLTKLKLVISPSTIQRGERIIHQRVTRRIWTPYHSLSPLLPFLCASLQRLHRPETQEDFWEELHMLSGLLMFVLCAFRCFPMTLSSSEKGNSVRVY